MLLPVSAPLTAMKPIAIDPPHPSAAIEEKIKRATGNIWYELATGFSVQAGFALAFGAVPITATVVTAAVLASMVVYALAAATNAYLEHEWVEKEAGFFFSPLRMGIAATVGSSAPNILIHEAGHALTGMLCFSHARPQISIDPYQGGKTTIHMKTLSSFGEKIGKENAAMIFAAGGFMASLTFALFEFGLAEALRERNPAVSDYFNGHALSLIIQEVAYGVCTLLATNATLANDFMRLWVVGGIHPLIPIALLIVIPLLEVAILKALAWRKSSQKLQQIGLNLQKAA